MLMRKYSKARIITPSWFSTSFQHVVLSAFADMRAAHKRFASWSVHPTSGRVVSSESTTSFQVKVGLEIHAQLNIPTKLFSPMEAPMHSTLQYEQANSRVHPWDAAVPGTMPFLSQAAVRTACLAAAALQCQIQTISRFERKHYAYADLPHGYQITQQRWPLAVNGMIECNYRVADEPSPVTKKNIHNPHIQPQHNVRCRVNRVQLEIDTGKTTTMTKYGINPKQTEIWSRVDLNRAGTALIEIVTEPDLRSSAEAVAAVLMVRQLLQHTQSCNGRMEAGQLRVDCNINIVEEDVSDMSPTQERRTEAQTSPLVEVKNLNSLEQVRDAINYEAQRHAAILMDQHVSHGESLFPAETRTWNVTLQRTELIRIKDNAQDYRFFPDPDLPPLVLNERVLGEPTLEIFLERHLPELPAAAIQRLQQICGLSEAQAEALARDPPTIAFFDQVMALVAPEDLTDKHRTMRAVKVANLIVNELLALLKDDMEKNEESRLGEFVGIENSHISPEQIADLVLLWDDGKISSTMSKKLLTLLYTDPDCRGVSPRLVAAERGIQLVTDTDQLREFCISVIAKNPDLIEIYCKGGKFVARMQKLFTGKVMAASGGNAHPERLREILEECLEQEASSMRQL